MNPAIPVILFFFAMSRVPKERRPKMVMIITITACATFLFFFLVAALMGFFTR
jgi:hypothetical protein